MTPFRCRGCGLSRFTVFCDLGLSPISNAFVLPDNQDQGEVHYPLRAVACDACHLVQLDASPDAQAHFHADYVYFSSFSDAWLKHASDYVNAVTARFRLGATSKVIEVASNDGYLLRNFVRLGIPCLGIEPSANTARVAREHGVETLEAFFGLETARGLAARSGKADLMIGNNVLAHVPELHDFLAGFTALLADHGVVTFEFPHLLRQVLGGQFDTIYHEHYSYLSLIALAPLLRAHRLRAFDVQEVPTHGGSLRLYLCHAKAAHADTGAVQRVLAAERAAGLDTASAFARFGQSALQTKLELLQFFVDARRAGKRIVAYGAAAKGNTLLNYCGITTEFVEFVVDRNPAKQGKLLPGSRIPVQPVSTLADARPDYVLILPWNIKDEVMQQMQIIREWGGRFVIPVPGVEVIE